DPAAIQGREQAQAHRQAGLDMPGSLRVLRLLRRDFDDLVRESWVDKESRARAHEDVERFFERMLIGHFVAWAGSVAAPPPAAPTGEVKRLSGLLAQRDDELKRAMDAARQATSGLRKSRERASALAAELTQAQAWAKTQLEAQESLKAELAVAKEPPARAETGAGAGDSPTLKVQYAAAQARLETYAARAKAQNAQRAELEAQLAEARSALAAQREEAQGSITRAESQTLQAQREAEEAREQALRDVGSARAEAEAAIEELRRAREGHASLASEAEAMRTRLAETGSRMAEARQTEEGDLQVRLAQATSTLAQSQERVQTLEAKLREAGQNVQGLSARLAEQESLHAFKDERMREQSRAVTETQELLARLGATKDEIVSRALTAEAERDQMRAERDQVSAERDQVSAERAAARKQLARQDASRAEAAAQSQAVRAECGTLTAELARVRLELAAAASGHEELSGRAQALETERNGLAERLIQTGNALDLATRQGQAAVNARDACTRLLSTHLALTPDAVATADSGGGALAWNPRFAELFGLTEADRAGGLKTVLPRLAARLERPKPWLARVRELLANPGLAEAGQTLATTTGQTLVFRSQPTARPEGGSTAMSEGAGGRLFSFRDVSLEHDMEHLVREIENITREELGQSLTAFIHLPQELLDDPAVTPAQAGKLTVIRDSGYRIVNTVNMAVDIFRMERGLYQMPPGSTLDLAVVARRAAKDAGPLAASRHIGLELLLGGSPLPMDAVLPAPGYAIPAHALALNLLRDALEAAPRQSRVQAVLRIDEAANVLGLDITRPGSVSPEEQARFFDKPVGAEAQDGLARGRYAARLIAGSFGGSLTVRSSPETGTTLSLRLPKG
ncbi:MAG: hypothetical protein Q7U56_11490, partial [Humidesulfovibrio sp.]|nr:hypothetical protein [Humidesulfovibrio sp.]